MRYELTDFEWTAIRPFLPNKPRGVPRVNDRRVLNGIFWILRSGAPWRDLPEGFGPYTTCYNRFVRWRMAGIWDLIMEAFAEAHDSSVQMIDTSIVRVHQHGGCAGGGEARLMGRSRGGLTTKIHACVDTNGLPVRLELTTGEAHDNRLVTELLSDLKSGAMLLADRGYDADWIREFAGERGAWANIPPKRNRKGPICFSPYLYRARNLVERFFNRIKQCRRVATRYDKLAANYLAFIKLAAIRVWLRAYESTPYIIEEGQYLFFPVVNYVTGDHEPIHEMLNDPACLLGLSDGGAHCTSIVDSGLPSFMLAHWGRDRRRGPRLPLEHLVKRQTSETADFFGMSDRGRLAPGLRADVNIIDFDRLRLHKPELVHDMPAGGRRFVQRVEGYEATLAAGIPIFERGEHTGAMPGRLLRAGRNGHR
jgi:transposase